MPWWACEFAAVYDGSYFKGKQFLLTEYAAIMLGPEAYKLETDKQLEETVRLGLNNRGHGQDMRHVAQYTPLYYEVQKRYVEAMDRAWRTYGVLGWHYFNFHLGYGDPPETKGYKPFARYSVMTRPVTGRPTGRIRSSTIMRKTCSRCWLMSRAIPTTPTKPTASTRAKPSKSSWPQSGTAPAT